MKYKVEVGGYVSTYRHRNLIVSANSEDEAKEKAIGKFMDLQQQGGNMCDGGDINSIEEVEGNANSKLKKWMERMNNDRKAT